MAGDADFRPWKELIPDALGLIFSKLDEEEILGVIPLVCKSWCEVVEGPYCWQTINTYNFLNDTVHEKVKVEQVLRALIPRSSGSLRELYVSHMDDRMLSLIAEHVGSLETLDIEFSLMNESTFEQFATQLGSLTTLVIRSNQLGMSQRMLEGISKNCKRLASLSWEDIFNEDDIDLELTPEDVDDCYVCSMPNLKSLSLRYSLLKPPYFFSLLSGSPKLEWVEVRGLKLDPGAVKEKYPNIVTLVLDSDNDESDSRDDFEWDYFSDADSYEYGGHEDYRSYEDEGVFSDLLPFWSCYI